LTYPEATKMIVEKPKVASVGKDQVFSTADRLLYDYVFEY